MVHQIHQLVWGPWLLAAFLLIGLLYSVKFRFFQVRKFSFWWRRTAGAIWRGEGKEEGKEGRSISQFATACTALAATVGTGNIVGVATALTAGGPGAIFWMWVSAAVGMITAYAETALGIRYRYQGGDGHWICGPMVYLERGLGSPALGILYALFCALASFGMGSMVQANSISESLYYSFEVKPVLVGVVLTVITMFVILGGIGRIAGVSQRLVPLSAGVYTIASLIIIMAFYDRIPSVFLQIVREAFRPASVAGGAAGYGISRCIQYGMARGVFSNEAGLGSLAILHGSAGKTTPKEQGMWAMFEVFFDTIISCSLTALVILCVTDGELGSIPLDGGALTAYCFSQCFGRAGEYLVSCAMVLFAFATIIAWFYLGRQAVTYLTKSDLVIKIYSLIYLNAVFLGCIVKLGTVWEISDIFNGLMAVPNLIALFVLARQVERP